MSTSNVKPFQPVTGARKSENPALPDVDDDVVEALAQVKAKPDTVSNDNPQGEGASSPNNDENSNEPVKTGSPSVSDQVKARLEKPTPPSEYEHINVGLPPYLMEQLRLKAIQDKSSVRFEILRGLRRIGYDIKDADMIKDARRGKGSARRRKKSES